MTESVLDITDLKTYFHTEDGVVRAVDGVSFNILPGHTLGIVGESGSGKSVTSLSIMQLLTTSAKIESGRIALVGKDLVGLPEPQMRDIRGKDVSMIFQEPMTSLNPVYTVGSQVMEAIIIHQHVSKEEARERTIALFEEVGIPSAQQRVDFYPHEMSGGQKQRVMIAMALSCNPKAADRRRAYHGVGRDDPGADTRQAPRAARPARHGHPVHHARPGRHCRDRRRSAGDVSRRDGRIRQGARHLFRTPASLHEGAPGLPTTAGQQVSPSAHGRRLHGGARR